MFNQQRTFISDRFLLSIEILSCFFFLFFLIYIYKLLKSLDTDTVNPSEIYQKINSLKVPQHVNHIILTLSLVLRGWWITGIFNFPFIFYDFLQLHENTCKKDFSRVFVILFREIKVIKAKVCVFLTIFIYNIWLWVTWTPPSYLLPGAGWNVVKLIQVSH